MHLLVAIEIPYLFLQIVEFVIITYPMIGYYGLTYKVFCYLYTMMCTIMCFNYLGMMLVSLTPNFMMFAILCSPFNTTFTLFIGFPIPKRVKILLFMKGTYKSYSFLASISQMCHFFVNLIKNIMLFLQLILM